MKTRLTLIATAIALALPVLACNALIGLDSFSEDPCAQGCDSGGSDAADAIAPSEAGDGGMADTGPVIVPIPVGAAPVSWAQWPMPSPDGGPNPFSYKLNADGSVTDAKTGLVWLPSSTAPFATTNIINGFNAARAYCASLGDGGTTWRLPTRIELITLIDYSRSNLALDPNFVNDAGLSGGWYWSASVVRPPTANYQFWAVNFTTGEVSTDTAGTSDPRTALCVKAQ